jgi:hypothetical protein
VGGTQLKIWGETGKAHRRRVVPVPVSGPVGGGVGAGRDIGRVRTVPEKTLENPRKRLDPGSESAKKLDISREMALSR